MEIQWCKEKLVIKFNITEMGSIKKHLGINYKWDIDEDGNRMLIASMRSMADEIVAKFRMVTGRDPELAMTPGKPNFGLVKNLEDPVMLDAYRSIIGKVMYYVTKISPECANPARELSQHMSNPGEQHWIALERLCGYIRCKDKHEIVYRYPKSLKVMAYVDSDYAKNTDTRRSVSGYVTTLGGVITTWASKTQHTVALSSTEAEYMALSLCAQEVVFMQMLLDEIIGCEKPGLIYEDNTGAIFLVKNSQVGQRTKHIDIRHHFLRDLWKSGQIEVVYVKSEDNIADLLTKNVPEATFERLAHGLLSGSIVG
jgi:hypothetical protein